MTEPKQVTVRVVIRQKNLDRIRGLAAERDSTVTTEINNALALYAEIMKHIRPGSHIEVVHKDGSGVTFHLN